MQRNTMLLIGHAKLPQGVSAKGAYDVISFTAEVDRKYGVVVDCDCSLILNHTRDFIRSIVIGHSLIDGVDDLVKEIEENYYGSAKMAVIASLRDLSRKWKELSEP